MPSLHFGFVVLAILPAGSPSAAQQPGPRIGVVLSGGAAKGLAHIGVLQVLERAGVPVDAITGTSMGALVGGLYAVGYGADSLAAIALTIPWDAVLNDRIARRHLLPEQKLADGRHLATLPVRGLTPTLPTRLVGGHNVRQLLARLTWSAAFVRDFRTLPIPYAAVATDLETGEAEVFTTGPLLDALSATMAIPGVFQPFTLGDRAFVDGGVVRNLPAQDALALGADFLICSDVTAPLKSAAALTSLFGVVNQTLSLSSAPAHRAELARCDILIEPNLEGLGTFDFGAAPDWIARGVAAADSARGRLDSLVAALGRRRVVRKGQDPVPRRIDALVTPALDSAHARLVRRRLGLNLPRPLDADDLANAMDRLYASRDFDQVGYVLEHTGDTGARVIVRTGTEGGSALGIGARYEGAYKASLLFTADFQDRLGTGSVTTLDVRLGEQLRAAGIYARRLGTLTPWALRFRAGYDRIPVDLYTDGQRTEEGRFHILGASALAGVAAGTAGLLGARIHGEHTITAVTTGAPADSGRGESHTHYTAGGTLLLDTRDDPALPHGGVLVRATSEWADRAIGSGATFQQHVVRASAAIPAGPLVSVLLRGDLGTSAGDELPANYRFFIGGAVPYFMLPDRHLTFLGLRIQERSGRHVQVAGAGLQVRLPADLFVQLLWNAGTVLETWSFEPGEWTHGVGTAVTWRTPFGLVAASVAGEAWEGPYRLEADLGFRF